MRFKQAWDHFWLWVDWHGRLSTIAIFIVACGGATLVNRILSIWSQVSGVYLWVITAMVFVIFLCTLILAGRALGERYAQHHLEDANTSEDSNQKHFDWHAEWIKLENSFMELDDDSMYLECARDRAGGERLIIGKKVDSNAQIDRFRALCEIAGKILISSQPTIAISDITRSQFEHSDKWLSHVRDLQGYTEPAQYCYGKGVSFEGGKLHNIGRQSALACMKCLATTYG